jgi:hypothetical protein
MENAEEKLAEAKEVADKANAIYKVYKVTSN